VIGNSELLIILLVALLLFGGDKLPELARSLGKAVAEYRRAMQEAEEKLMAEDLKRELRQQMQEFSELKPPGVGVDVHPAPPEKPDQGDSRLLRREDAGEKGGGA